MQALDNGKSVNKAKRQSNLDLLATKISIIEQKISDIYAFLLKTTIS